VPCLLWTSARARRSLLCNFICEWASRFATNRRRRELRRHAHGARELFEHNAYDASSSCNAHTLSITPRLTLISMRRKFSPPTTLYSNNFCIAISASVPIMADDGTASLAPEVNFEDSCSRRLPRQGPPLIFRDFSALSRQSDDTDWRDLPRAPTRPSFFYDNAVVPWLRSL